MGLRAVGAEVFTRRVREWGHVNEIGKTQGTLGYDNGNVWLNHSEK